MPVLIFLLSFMLGVSSVAAAERLAFAAVQAPEQAFEICHAATAEKASDCAMEKCVKIGGADCTVLSSCASGWAGTIGIRMDEIHFTDVVCGAPSKAAIIESLMAFCKGHLPAVKECYIASAYSPFGVEEKLEMAVDPKALN